MKHSKDPYDQFADIYDQEAHQNVTAAFFQAAHLRIGENPADGTVLDLGCGTGGLTAMLAADGKCVVGVDRSRKMLATARHRCRDFGRKVSFVQSDLARLPCNRKFSLGLACGDIINHLSSLAVVKKVFRKVCASLQDGGQFIFDSLNRFCFEYYWDRKTYYLESPAGDLVMDCTWNAGKLCGTARMIAFAKMGTSSYKKTESSLKEHLYDEGDLHAALLAAGFDHVHYEPWSPWADQHLEPALDRNLWIATAP